MAALRHWGWLFVVSLVVMTSCGGGTVPGGIDDSSQPGIAPAPAVLAELPSIPYEIADVPREPSTEGSGSLVILGKDYWEWMLHGTIIEDSLLLEAPLEGGEEPPIAYAMYRVTELAGKRPTSMNLECVPRTFDHEYYLGIANYTEGNWEWFGPIRIPEYSVDLSDKYDRYITELGNLYFILVCHAGNDARHDQTTILFEDDPGGLPGAPREMWASDGSYEDKVRVEWVAGAEAEYYELWRKVDGEECDWYKIAEPDGVEYNDFEVDAGQVYLYKARSVNTAGFSSFSNIDSGYAAGATGNCVIEGTVWNGEEGRWPGVTIYLLGRPEVLETITDEYGAFRFGDLPQGHYIVVAYHHELDFDPWHVAFELCGEEWFREVDFWGYPTENPNHIRGYLYNYHESEGFWAINGAGVDLDRHEGEGHWETTSNELGFFHFLEMPVGIYLITPSFEAWGHEWEFDPEVHDANVNGETLPDILFFRGAPAECGDPPGTPYDLVASDGLYEDKVRVEWEGGEGAEWFRVKRQRVDPLGEWGVIGEAEGHSYNDYDVDPEVVYNYKVQAVNDYGSSDWSNIDSGYSAGGSSGCIICGHIVNGEEEPLNDIKVTLLGPGEPLVTYTDGEEGGYYCFEDLPHGYYIVVPFSQAWDFDPVYTFVNINEAGGQDGVNFVGTTAGVFWRIWGFVYSFDGEANNGFKPMAGVDIEIAKDGSEDTWNVETNEHGYYLKTELPTGSFLITPSYEGYGFWPALHDATIDGEEKVPPLNFEGETVE